MKTKRIYTYLCGGLGNQMFQYATARALALDHDAELVLDPWSGFVRDFQYRRHYELDQLPIQARIASSWERLPLWLYRLENSLRQKIRKEDEHPNHTDQRPYGKFIVETQKSYLPSVNQLTINSPIWLLGYWQSPKYFESHSDILLNELMPSMPTEPEFLEVGNRLREVESVALGVRLYEESLNPNVHAKDGQMKSVADINRAIERLRYKSPQAQFFVFCTHRSTLLNQLNLPPDSIFLTHDNGYEGTLQRLWLLSQCRHHIFTNSSYYWWGAWLSQKLYQNKQLILCADNFINCDSPCKQWSSF